MYATPKSKIFDRVVPLLCALMQYSNPLTLRLNTQAQHYTTAPTPILHCHLHNAPLAEFAPPLLLHRAWSDWPPLQDFRTASPRLSGLNPRRGISTDYSMDLAGIIFWEGGVCQPLSSHPTPPVLAKAVTGWEKSASASLNIIIMHAHLNVGGMLRVKRLSLGSQIGG